MARIQALIDVLSGERVRLRMVGGECGPAAEWRLPWCAPSPRLELLLGRQARLGRHCPPLEERRFFLETGVYFSGVLK